MNTFVDAHYFQIPTQGNIYTLTNLQMKNKTNKILVAARKEIFLFDYAENNTQSLSPTTKEVPFSYIPSGAEIISLDAFNKSSTKNDHVIGITLIKKGSDDSKEMYLNIYSENADSNKGFNIESIAQNCCVILLWFIPYQLTHTNLPIWRNNSLISNEIVFLLTGSDNMIHLYQEDKERHNYKETELLEYFPEFSVAPSVIMWIHVQYYDNTKRISVIGCECGYIRVSIVNCITSEILSCLSTRLPNIISNVTLFTDKINIKPVYKSSKLDADSPSRHKQFSLLVTNTLIPSVVFKNIDEHGFAKKFILERYNCYNVFSCSAVADISFNGLPNIIIGSREHELLFYKQDAAKGWVIRYKKIFAHSILALLYLDVTGDGVKELIVSTTKGVHILQHEPAAVQKAIEQKIQSLYIPNVESC